MSVNYDAATETARMQAVLDKIDSNASPATLQLFTASYAQVLVTLVLSKPSFTLSGSVLTMLGMPKAGVATSTGIATLAVIKDGASNIRVSGLTVGNGSGNEDIILNNPSISFGQQVTLSSSTLTHS